MATTTTTTETSTVNGAVAAARPRALTPQQVQRL